MQQAPVKPAKEKEDSPLMVQYNTIKAKYPDALLLFRVGDFYETFSEDAVKTSKILGIVLTKRSNGSASEIELAGFPYHSLDTYLPRLVRAGMRVAICDQLEDPKLTKKIVKRGVTEVITPGVAFSDKILDHKSNNFLAAFHTINNTTGIALIDVSTGEFFVTQGTGEYPDKIMQSFDPSEVLLSKPAMRNFEQQYGKRFYTYSIDDWVFQSTYANDVLLKHFETSSLKGFGIEELDCGIIAAGAIIHYLQTMQPDRLQHINRISRVEEERYVWLDKFTIRNLELISSPHEKARTLLEVLDKTVSPMGSRMMRRWILLPLKERVTVEERLEVVEFFSKHDETAHFISQQLKVIGDLERLTSKISIRKINPREVQQLKRALTALDPIRSACMKSENHGLKTIAEQINLCKELLHRVETTIQDDPPAMINKGGVIRKGISAELDELREIAYSGKDYLLQIQQEEIQKTGITNLKISFNNVFGYFIEVTNSHKHKVPAGWIRKQTLTNAERYITEELKHYEEKILGAEEKILALEEKLFIELIAETAEYIPALQLNSNLIARLDCLLSFAIAALEYNYVKPHLNDGLSIDIRSGRHPVLERQLPLGESYIANDVYLDQDNQQIIVITGPNMSGKSALLRQTALIVLMAQTGSFVPAASAEIGMVDKIFTRVGASDNISQGESTFMVEMNETASILNNLSTRSLILLDEIGRGTSTYDGISIAWAIAEYIHEHPQAKAKTLFATHYHELNEMTAQFPRIKNYNIAIKESGNKILFLRKLVPGGSEHSFGIHVAKMAGMPDSIVHRANKMLGTLEKAHSNTELIRSSNITERNEHLQLSFFQLDDPLLEQIRDEILQTDIETLTPVEALLKLHEIKKLIVKEKAKVSPPSPSPKEKGG